MYIKKLYAPISCGLEILVKLGSRSPDAKIKNHSQGWNFLLYQKSTIKFNYYLRGIFAKNSQIFIFLCLLTFQGISFLKLKWLNFICPSLLKGILI